MTDIEHAKTDNPTNVVLKQTTSGNDLYDDFRVVEQVQLSAVAQERLAKYIEQLNQLSKQIRLKDDSARNMTLWKTWEMGLREFYKALIFDAFKNLDIKPPEGMEINFAGSLAKSQATEYSDLDAFVLLKKAEDVALVQPVFAAINNVCQRIFLVQKQLYPDPVGINPSRLIGTVDSLMQQLINDELTHSEATIHSIITSRPILGHYALGEQLKQRIKTTPEFQGRYSAEAFYQKAINDFAAPREDMLKINIKEYVMRPLDFILMGLRAEFNLEVEDGSHLSAPGTLLLLRKKQLISEADIVRLERVYNEVMSLRFALHSTAHGEQDEVARDEVEHLLQEVQTLRDFAQQRHDAIEHRAMNKEPGFFARNASVFKILGFIGLALIVGAAVGAGLALGGLFVLPVVLTGLAAVAVTAAAGAVAGVALLGAGFGISKLVQAVSRLFTHEPRQEEQPPPNAPSVEALNASSSYSTSLSGLSKIACKPTPAQEPSIEVNMTTSTSTQSTDLHNNEHPEPENSAQALQIGCRST
ncbi:MAG: hypothetical protein ACRC0M_03260 [Legionella sp.]